MYIARIKFTRNAIPHEYEFRTRVEAEKFAAEKKTHNPYVRWTEIDTTRQYPKED